MLADRTIAPLPTRAATATLVVATDACEYLLSLLRSVELALSVSRF